MLKLLVGNDDVEDRVIARSTLRFQPMGADAILLESILEFK